jgi:hypothetical protein
MAHLAEAFDHRPQHPDRDGRVRQQERVEPLGGDPQRLDRLNRPHGGAAALRRDQGHLAEEVPGREPVEPTAHVHLGGAGQHDEHRVARLALFDDRLLRFERDGRADPKHAFEIVVGKLGEERDASKGDRSRVHRAARPRLSRRTRT